MIGTDAVRGAVQMALVSLASYSIGFYSTSLFHDGSASIGGLWSAISGVMVLQATRRDTWSAASLRILGTLIGSIVSAAYLAVLPFNRCRDGRIHVRYGASLSCRTDPRPRECGSEQRGGDHGHR